MEHIFEKFEGVEKHIEFILSTPQPGLRSNKDGRWDKVVKASKAHIISSVSSEYADAYLLSESSLFVWDDCLIMITCGQTVLTNILEELLKIVDKDNIDYVFYERKNLMFPEDQPSNFEDEVKSIVEFFPGKSYRLGPANLDHLHVFSWAKPGAVPEQDVTLRVLMTELDPSVMNHFSPEHVKSATEVGEKTGLSTICSKTMKMDHHLFEPCGYSMNGLSGKDYVTVHVTPQECSSYASFETNIIEDDYSPVIRDTVSIFKPGKFSIALTTSMEDSYESLHHSIARALPGYNLVEKSLYEFDCGYKASYLNYDVKASERDRIRQVKWGCEKT